MNAKCDFVLFLQYLYIVKATPTYRLLVLIKNIAIIEYEKECIHH